MFDRLHILWCKLLLSILSNQLQQWNLDGDVIARTDRKRWTDNF